MPSCGTGGACGACGACGAVGFISRCHHITAGRVARLTTLLLFLGAVSCGLHVVDIAKSVVQRGRVESSWALRRALVLLPKDCRDHHTLVKSGPGRHLPWGRRQARPFLEDPRPPASVAHPPAQWPSTPACSICTHGAHSLAR